MFRKTLAFASNIALKMLKKFNQEDNYCDKFYE